MQTNACMLDVRPVLTSQPDISRSASFKWGSAPRTTTKKEQAAGFSETSNSAKKLQPLMRSISTGFLIRVLFRSSYFTLGRKLFLGIFYIEQNAKMPRLTSVHYPIS